MSQKTENFGEPIDRLLQAYETAMQALSFFVEIHQKMGKNSFIGSFWDRIIEGPLRHWQELRGSLLKVHTEEFDFEKYIGPQMDEVPHEMNNFTFYRQRIMASEVVSWTKSSRRVYRISKDLQILLASTSLKDVDWSMINWPFDSFLVSLEEPFILNDKSVIAIMVAKHKMTLGEIITFEPITTDLPTMKTAFIGDQFLRIKKAIKKNDFDSLMYANDKVTLTIKNRISAGGALVVLNNNCFQPGGAATVFEQEILPGSENDNGSKIICRVVFGLLLYLQSRPAIDLVPRGWERSLFERKESQSRMIRIPSEVCLVKSIYSLSDTERKIFEPVLRGECLEKSSHYREGHWRRPPGKGTDPKHPKTVWVCPTIVRRDKLIEGGLPVGSAQIIT